MIHFITPSIQQIESELHRSLNMSEKKRLAQDDYSTIKRRKLKREGDIDPLANVQRFEVDLGCPLTTEEN